MTVTPAPLFAYGTMLDLDVLEIVLARPVARGDLMCARLAGQRRVRLVEETYPTLRQDCASTVYGTLVMGLDAQDWDRIAFFESVEYVFKPCEVTLADGTSVQARFCCEQADSNATTLWQLAWWQCHHKQLHLPVFRAYMALHGHVSLEQADAQWERLMADISDRAESVPLRS